LKQKTLQDRVKQLRQRNLELREKLRGGKKFREQKVRFQNAQLAILERSLEVADFQFNPKNREDLRQLQIELLHRQLQRTISQTDFALGNQAIGNLIRITETTELEDRINELNEQAQIARKVLTDRIGMETDNRTNTPTLTATAPRPRTVDTTKPDSERATV
jgi:vacuolar-type H+-ATPase subunit I/STV1